MGSYKSRRVVLPAHPQKIDYYLLSAKEMNVVKLVKYLPKLQDVITTNTKELNLVNAHILNLMMKTNYEVSTTSLLMRDIAHSTRHSFRPKTNNQSFKKFLSLVFS